MKIPKGMTEQDVHDTFMNVINKISPKYTFNGYDINDIKQEAYIICISAMDRYQEGRPLENFLSVNLSNRLKNLLRDNNIYNTNELKKQIAHPVSLSQSELIIEDMDDSTIELNEIKNIIDQYLPFDLRKDYLKLANGLPVKPKRKEEIINTIKEILNEKGQDL